MGNENEDVELNNYLELFSDLMGIPVAGARLNGNSFFYCITDEEHGKSKELINAFELISMLKHWATTKSFFIESSVRLHKTTPLVANAHVSKYVGGQNYSEYTVQNSISEVEVVIDAAEYIRKRVI